MLNKKKPTTFKREKRIATKSKVKKINIQTPKGMHDILWDDWAVRERLFKAAKDILSFYGFNRIETPIVEYRELFERTLGESTDIVEKEMYTVRSKGKSDLVMRPEMTASVMRSYIEHGMHRLPQPQKFYYIGPAFRHENPQAGRYREFWQIGAEVIGGDSDPIFDAQIIIIFHKLLEALKITPVVVGINTIGSLADRQHYKKKLIEHYKKHQRSVCVDCKRRVKENALRVLDCKVKSCQDVKESAPIILDHLSGASKLHFKQVLEFLDEMGVPYVLRPKLVRGLDYYNKTVFEIFTLNGDGTDGLSLLGGGRYDYLSESMGGRATAGMGAAMGVERVVDVLKERYPDFGNQKNKKTVSLIHVGQLAKKKSALLLEELRGEGIAITSNLGRSSLSNQLESADKVGASFALILGQKEVFEESVIIRDMKTGAQETVPLAKIVKELRKRL